jgi:signal peptidase I
VSDLREVATQESSPEKVYVGQELSLDLWVQSKAADEKSMLIRKTTPSGETSSVLLHIENQAIKVIPNFSNSAGQSLSNQNTVPEISHVSEKRKVRLLPVIEYVSLILGVVFLVFSATGIFQTRVILTGSMKPTLDPGDVVFAVAPSVLKPEVGKTVIYTARDLSGNAVTQWAHRIISGSDKDGWTIKGDANPAADVNTVPTTDISSVVLFSIPFVGKFFNPLTLILFGLGLILLIFVISRIKD